MKFPRLATCRYEQNIGYISMLPNQLHHNAPFWISTLGLTRHPEGGWFRESYRSAESIPAGALPGRFGGERSICTSIYFLLERGECSALHRIRSDEIWHFHEGGPLIVHVLPPNGEKYEIRLGRDP